MGIPAFFIALFAVLILLAATVAVYFQVYKRHINRALEATEGKRTIMVSPYKAAIVLTIIVLFIGIVISYFAGYYYAYKQYEEDIWVMSDSDIQAFYAEVKKVDEHSLLVKGISLNDEDYQGEFQFNDLWEGLSVYRKDTPIKLSDLSEGDLFSIILLTDRMGNTNIFKIQLLTDVN